MDGLQNYFLVDKDPRMQLAKKLGESGSCIAAVNILIHLLKPMGASDDFIGRMTNVGVLVEMLKSNDGNDYQNEECMDGNDDQNEQCMEPAFARVFFMIGDLVLKNEETEGELKKTWIHTTEETCVAPDAYNGLNVTLAMAHQCIYHSQQILARLTGTEAEETNVSDDVRRQMLLDLAETHSRIGDIMRIRRRLVDAIHSYHNSIQQRDCVTCAPKKLIARDHYHLSLCYEELYGEMEEGGNRAVKEGDEGEEEGLVDTRNFVGDLCAAELLHHAIGHSFASLSSLALYLAESRGGDYQDIGKEIQEIGKEALKDDGDLVGPKQAIHFDQKINRIIQIMNEIPRNDSDEELGIIQQFVTDNILVRVRQMALYVSENNEIGNKGQQSVQIV